MTQWHTCDDSRKDVEVMVGELLKRLKLILKSILI